MTEPTQDIRNADFSSSNPAVIEYYEDYFGFGDIQEFTLPDGKQKIFFKIMNEGERSKFQRKTSRDLKFNRSTQDVALKADQAADRRELLMTSVTGWSLKRRQNDGTFADVPFTPGEGGTFGQWLQVANPKIVDDLEFAIRRANPWMQADMTVEEIDKEVERLNELRGQAEERERGK